MGLTLPNPNTPAAFQCFQRDEATLLIISLIINSMIFGATRLRHARNIPDRDIKYTFSKKDGTSVIFRSSPTGNCRVGCSILLGNFDALRLSCLSGGRTRLRPTRNPRAGGTVTGPSPAGGPHSLGFGWWLSLSKSHTTPEK